MRTFLFALLTCAALASAQKIVGGPYAVNTTSRSATVVWIVQTDEAVLQVPATAGAPATTKPSPSFRVEKTTFTGLLPNTKYEYRAGNQDAGKGSFKTPPAGVEPYRFVVYGDNRTRHDVHRKVIATLLKEGVPDFVVQTGDMVENGTDNFLWPIFFDIERELLRQTAFFPSLGNHERNTSYYYNFFQSEKPYYSFNWGNAHFSVLDSDIPNVAPTKPERDAFWTEQVRWLEADLEAHQKDDYRFIVAHHPPMTAVSRRQESNKEMASLVPLLEKYRVTAGFFGHDHNYQHFLKNGIHYVVTGGGGAPLYDVDKPPEGITVKVASIENFVTVSVNGKTAHIKAIAIDGKILDEFDFQVKQ